MNTHSWKGKPRTHIKMLDSNKSVEADIAFIKHFLSTRTLVELPNISERLSEKPQ